MDKKRLYSEDEVIGILMNLANGIGLCAKGDIMPTRYKQKVHIGGEDHWVTGRTLKDLLEAYLELCIDQGTVTPNLSKEKNGEEIVTVGTYLENYNKIYKTKQQALTKEGRERIIKNHILPRIGDKALSSLTINDFQIWFNELDVNGYSHETLLKIKNTLSPALEAAVEDGYLVRNPLKSNRLVIGGKETEHHKAIPEEKMKQIREGIPELSDIRVRMMLALFCYTGMRMEEVLGLRWEDIDFDAGWIHIQRAVVHPKRNLAEVKPPKSKTSDRRIPLPKELNLYLKPREATGFILYSYSDSKRETPMSYTEARRVFQKIRDAFGLEGYSAHDFRDTCATEWREAGIPIDVISRLLGHSKSDITEKRYVKYRDEIFQDVRNIFEKPEGTEKEQDGMR